MRSIFALALVASLSIAPSVRAQDTDPSHVAAARALFQEGLALARRGEYADATDRFRRAQALRPAPPIAFNLASALVHQGALLEASEILERLLHDPTITAELRTSATHQRDQIAPRLARLTVRVAGDHTGVRIEVDAHALPDAAIGVPVPIDPGPHEVRALRDGAEAAHETVTLAEGETGQVQLTIAAAPVVASGSTAPTSTSTVSAESILAPPPPIDQSPSGNNDGLWIGLGIGAVLLVGAAVTIPVVIVTMPAAPTPVSGNTMPAVLTW